MRIIRPYGESRTRQTPEGRRRVLIDNSAGRAAVAISEFARTHDELVIAQWISAVDKIATKPSGQKPASEAQREFRQRLGDACWERLSASCGSAPCLLPGANREYLQKLWQTKIHPYPAGTPKKGKPEPEVTGRWYRAFAGSAEPANADAKAIGELIEKHLHEAELRRGPNGRPKRKGRIQARAETIEKNVLKKRTPAARPAPSPDIVADYLKGNSLPDPVRAIREKAEAIEKNHGRVWLADAGKILYEHWGTRFGTAAGAKEVEDKYPELFALHSALKDCYRRLLKRNRKDTSEHRKKDRDERRLSSLLPANIQEALRLSGKQQANADLNHLVRLGKVMHYSASGGQADRTRSIQNNWPAQVDNSRFWDSDGQAEIKRAEAFVRIWRQALVHARWTLTDWVSMNGGPFQDDIFCSSKTLDKALDTGKFDADLFGRKLQLLFGSRANLFNLPTADSGIEFLRGLISASQNLRHAAFHFQGRGHLLDELAKFSGYFAGTAGASAATLWDKDVEERGARLKAVLAGVHVEEFLTQEQADKVFTLIAGDGVAELVLPRFSRVLRRGKEAWPRRLANKKEYKNQPAHAWHGIRALGTHRGAARTGERPRP